MSSPAPRTPSPAARCSDSVDHVKLVYMGTPEMAVAPLRALHAAGHDIVLVVSRPDKRRGRRGEPTPSPVKAAALGAGPGGQRRPRRPDRPLRRPGRGGGLRATAAPASAGRVGDGQPALLAVAPLAGCSAGRTGPPGRRRGHRCVSDEGRRGPGHRLRVRPRRGAGRCRLDGRGTAGCAGRGGDRPAGSVPRTRPR